MVTRTILGNMVLITIPDSLETGRIGIHIIQQIQTICSEVVIVFYQFIQVLVPFSLCAIGDSKCFNYCPGLAFLIVDYSLAAGSPEKDWRSSIDS